MEKLLISACLAGMNCRFDGGNNIISDLELLLERFYLIPVCPEVFGGMSTPRLPSEIKGNIVQDMAGNDVTDFFVAGAREVLNLAHLWGCNRALLKEKSPSCGCHLIYDGSFSKKLISGNGILARLLQDNGFSLFSECEINKLLL